jgi:hypothetical protein
MSATPPTRLLVACTMKSGSTYVSRVLSLYFGIPKAEPMDYWGRREQNLDAALVAERLRGSYVLQMHIKPYQPHLDLFREQGLRLFWLRRNLGDSLVSLDDHVANEAHENPVVYIHDRQAYLSMPIQERYAYLIRHATPWYIGFHLMWRRGIEGMPVVPGRYEDMIRDPLEFFRGLLAAAGYPVDVDRLREILSASIPQTRLNRGISGRSAAFSEANRRRLEEALREHPEDLGDLIEELPWRSHGLRGLRSRIAGWALPRLRTA